MSNENNKSKGLGDTIAKVTHATKLDRLAEGLARAFGKDDCGCEGRRESLNKKFPYGKGK